MIILVVTGTIMWGASSLNPSTSLSIPYRSFLCALTVVVGFGIALTAIRSFRAAETTTNPMDPDAVERLVTNGVYQLSRNPMYLGATLLLLALAVYLQNAMAFVTLPLFMIYLTFLQIRPEERILGDKFGEEFRSYKKSVRRWL